MNQLAKEYKRLMRLRAKRDRIQKHISSLEHKLQGKMSRWGSCSSKRNRR